MATQLSTYSIGAGEIKRLRAPRGYRVRQWADGFFHVYYGEECILETLSRHAAYSAAYLHRAAQPRNAGDVAPMGGDDEHSGDLAQRA